MNKHSTQTSTSKILSDFIVSRIHTQIQRNIKLFLEKIVCISTSNTNKYNSLHVTRHCFSTIIRLNKIIRLIEFKAIKFLRKMNPTP